jgi:hypothetical protein
VLRTGLVARAADRAVDRVIDPVIDSVIDSGRGYRPGTAG